METLFGWFMGLMLAVFCAACNAAFILFVIWMWKEMFPNGIAFKKRQ